MNQQDLADKLGVSQSTVSKYENGTHQIDIDTFLAISEALNIRTRDLVDGVSFD